MHRQLGDSWQEALATVHLADCEQALGRDNASRQQLAAVLTLLQQFPDTRVAQLRTVCPASTRSKLVQCSPHVQ